MALFGENFILYTWRLVFTFLSQLDSLYFMVFIDKCLSCFFLPLFQFASHDPHLLPCLNLQGQSHRTWFKCYSYSHQQSVDAFGSSFATTVHFADAVLFCSNERTLEILKEVIKTFKHTKYELLTSGQRQTQGIYENVQEKI